jgi:hypothetical protein
MYRPLSHGAVLVWRHQRLVWWIWFVNLFLGWLAAIAPRTLFGSAFNSNRSMLSADLVQRFDIGTFIALILKPEVSLRPLVGGSVAFSLVFLFYMLFISGGVLAVYNEDRRLSKAEFFGKAGEYFWRMVRLMLFSIIPFGIVLAVVNGVNALASKVGEKADTAGPEYRVLIIGGFICLLFALWVRAWFDLAQTRLVCDDERGMFFLTFRVFGLALRKTFRFWGIYLGTTVLCAIVAACAFLIWLDIPHASYVASWTLLEVLSLILIGMRLWQRAAMMVWYTSWVRVHQAPPAIVHAVIPAPVPMPTPPESQPETGTPVPASPAPQEPGAEPPITHPPEPDER